MSLTTNRLGIGSKNFIDSATRVFAMIESRVCASAPTTRRIVIAFLLSGIGPGCASEFQERIGPKTVGCQVLTAGCDFPGCVIHAYNECEPDYGTTSIKGADAYEIRLQQCFSQSTQQNQSGKDLPSLYAQCARSSTTTDAP